MDAEQRARLERRVCGGEYGWSDGSLMPDLRALLVAYDAAVAQLAAEQAQLAAAQARIAVLEPVAAVARRWIDQFDRGVDFPHLRQMMRDALAALAGEEGQ